MSEPISTHNFDTSYCNFKIYYFKKIEHDQLTAFSIGLQSSTMFRFQETEVVCIDLIEFRKSVE